MIGRSWRLDGAGGSSGLNRGNSLSPGARTVSNVAASGREAFVSTIINSRPGATPWISNMTLAFEGDASPAISSTVTIGAPRIGGGSIIAKGMSARARSMSTTRIVSGVVRPRRA